MRKLIPVTLTALSLLSSSTPLLLAQSAAFLPAAEEGAQLVQKMQALPGTAFNAGFAAMGGAGKGGKVSGGFGFISGTYRMEANNASEVRFTLDTNDVKGRMTLRPGSMGFVGRIYNPLEGRWRENVNSVYDVKITYDPSRDQGNIHIIKTDKDSPFSGGGRGGDKMSLHFNCGIDVGLAFQRSDAPR